MNPVIFYKCLADETRLRCLLLITQEKELSVGELIEALQDVQPKISRHLAHLRRYKILTDRRQGQWVFYRVHPTLPQWAKDILNNTLTANLTFLAKNARQLKKMKNRPERTYGK